MVFCSILKIQISVSCRNLQKTRDKLHVTRQECTRKLFEHRHCKQTENSAEILKSKQSLISGKAAFPHFFSKDHKIKEAYLHFQQWMQQSFCDVVCKSHIYMYFCTF